MDVLGDRFGQLDAEPVQEQVVLVLVASNHSRATSLTAGRR
jgi:hypothetical protein